MISEVLVIKMGLSTLALLTAVNVLCEPRLNVMQSFIPLRERKQLVGDVNIFQAYFCNFVRAVHNIAASWVAAKGAIFENLLSVSFQRKLNLTW
jgi:hypothetical protein